MTHASLRRLGLGLATLCGRPRGWFIPHRHAADAVPPAAYPALEAVFAAARAEMEALLAVAGRHAPDFARFGGAPPAPRFEQDWFPRLDLVAAYALLRSRRPARVIEVGSGHSTRLLSKALGGVGEILAIDPAPRADIADLPGVRVKSSTLQAAPDSVFDGLVQGDVLFIDSSHILMPGSDVDILLNRVLPRLPSGTLVHIHDIFLPFDYPAIWGWRAYNEQQGVVPLLTSGAFKPIFSSVWAERRMADRLAASVIARLPRPPDALPASLWLEKR